MKARLICLLFLLTYFTAHADDFIVNSNANDGIGTLRAALNSAAANGTLVKDHIKFNLPGNTEADRTIILTTELPMLTANIVIDATTQPGPDLGNSTAKIMLVADRYIYESSSPNLGGFNIIDISDVEIYGFAFDQFTNLLVMGFPYYYRSYNNSGIYIASSSNIIIGVPGKGNVFIENGSGIYASSDQDYQNTNGTIKIQSNWFGLDLNGLESQKNNRTYLALLSVNNLEFGGPDLTYGNILGGYSPYGLVVFGDNNKIRFNRFSYQADGSFGLRGVSISLRLTNGVFTDNQATRFAIELSGKNIKVLRNKEREIPIRILSQGIQMSYAENIQIGSENIEDANEFLPADYGPFSNFGSKNVEVRKNIIHCTRFAYRIVDVPLVKIQVLVNDDTEYSGTATPGSEIYIYNDNSDCTSCSPLQFYTKTTADATGKWIITGDFTNNRFVSNATLINTSSEFSQPQILYGNFGEWYTKTDPSCGRANGVIELVNTTHLLKVEWYNDSDVKVGEGIKIEHLPPGVYYAKGYNGKCYTISDEVTLMNVEPQFNTTMLNIQQPGCGENNGSIRGLDYSVFSGTATYKWVDENNQVVPSDNLDLTNIGPGKYTLVVTTGTNCTKSYGPIVLENTEGPIIKRADATTTPANCDNSDGSIIGITAIGLGNVQFFWKNDKNEIVSETADLINVKAGRYTLEVKDESACGIISSIFEITADHTISIDERSVDITKTTCGNANGSIIGITVVGADNLKWLNENGDVVRQSNDLTGVPSGKYRLVISNAYCSQTSSVFTIDEAKSNDNYSSVKQIRNATCNQNNGSITLNFNQARPQAFRWLNENNQAVVGTDAISDLSAGFYKLYIKDENSCESLYDTYEIITISPPVLNEAQVHIESDKCGLKTGGISGLIVFGGASPYRYEWRNQVNELVGTDLDLVKVAAGIYTVQVFDNENCSVLSSSFNISIEKNTLPDPIVLPVQICAAGKATIVPGQIRDAEFLLYKNLTATEPLATTKDVFNIQVSKSETYFVSYRSGICESNRVPILVEVAESALSIANSFSPNNDGINDTWSIKGLLNYPEFELKIYNRYGQNVFSTRDPHFAYNGTGNNGDLPLGVYYYVLTLRIGCSTITGSLTLLR